MVKIGMVQINNSFSGQNYLPLSTGMLQAYAQKNLTKPSDYKFMLPIYKRIPVSDAVSQLKDADVVFFSTYVWNFQISLEIARRHNSRIIFGGPHVPKDTESFLKKYPFIDTACYGEGERASVALLEGNHWTPSRIDDMNILPSPYLEGTFDPLIKAYPEENWIALWETNRGCPFNCTFCDWGTATKSKVFKFEIDRLYQEMDWFAQHKIEYIYCCDANFGMLPRDLDIVSYAVKTKSELGYPHKLSVQNTKNSAERSYAVQKILSDAGMNQGVTLSMQSLDENTLKSVKRANISLESFRIIQERFEEAGVETYTDLILGLPGETYDSFLDGTCKTIENGQHNRIQFNNLSILPNAEMAEPEYQKEYGIVTIEANIVNAHGSLDEHEIQEKQLLVVGTHSMPKEDWVKTRAMTWMVSLLYFDKLLSIPITLLHDKHKVPYRDIFERFMRPTDELIVLKGILKFFIDKARDIQNGGEEFCYSSKWLQIWWPADEYIFINLSVQKRIYQFYSESLWLLSQLHFGIDVIGAVRRNRKLLKQPDSDLDKWLKETVWWGNKKGAYLNASR